jgi:N-acetylmuramoyl-L-alanine amidase
MDAEYITIHNFGGSASAGAVTEYIDDTDEVKSWHFTVGKDVIYQEMPINKNAWHAGDGKDGPGNRKSIGIEIEENKEAMMNAVKLVAFLKQEKDYEIKTHQDWSGKNCPGWILEHYSKQYFIDAVDSFSELK